MGQTVQHKIVNRAATPPHPVRSIVATPRVQRQPALRVSSPSDPAEKEAEATARKIVRMRQTESSIANPTGPVIARSHRANPLSRHAARFSSTVIVISRSSRRIARKSEGQPDVGANVSAELTASIASGSPLPASVRRFMEPRFRADFGGVRIHTGDKAAKLNRQFSAQAFALGNQLFFGKDQFKPETDEGKELVAHELTHTIQQGAVAQRSADVRPADGAVVARRAEDVAIVQQTTPHVQRLGISDVLDYFAEKAYNIPGYRMFTLLLGVNPINMERVERSAANFLRAIVEFLPGGHVIVEALENHGIFDKVGNWVEQQLHTLGITGSLIKNAISDFLDSLGWRDIFHLGRVWDRAKRIFTDPIDRIISFAKSLFITILKFIRDAILRPLAKLAEGTRGYDLLKAILGRDPVTGEPVPQNADTLIGGFMKLIGQEEIWNNLKKANAVSRAWAWFKGVLSQLLGFVSEIPGLFIKALTSLELMDIVLVPRAFKKVAGVFGDFIGRFITWAGEAMWNLLEIIFAVVAPGAMPYLHKAKAAFRTILKNPIGFIGNLVTAGKRGFQQFGNNILKHLQNSLIQWLTGSLAGAALYIPQSFEFKEIVRFLLSVLGLTWANVRQKLVKAIGETAVKVLETGFDIVVTLVTEGPAAAWEKIKEQLANLKDMVIDEIKNFVVVKVVQSAVVKLVSMLNPAGAFIQAIIAIYNTVMFFIERLKQIIQVATAFIDSIAAIASGVIAAAANRVEQTLAGLLTLVISFLARLVGLGKVSDIIVNLLAKIRDPIDKALDKVIDWIVTMAQKVGNFLVGAAAKVFNWATAKSNFNDEDNKKHSVYIDVAGGAPKVAIASSPQPAEEFLDWYVNKRGANFKTDNAAKIATVRTAIQKTQTIADKIDKAEKAKKSDAALQRQLLEANVDVCTALSALIGTSSLAKVEEKYFLEGLTGTYGSMPKPKGDDFTADHQPQAAILEAAAEFDFVDDTGNLVKRAAGRARAGFAINLHKFRHEAGRTYGSKGKTTKDAFLKRVTGLVGKKRQSRAEQRKILVAEIRTELTGKGGDVASMRAVAQSKSDPLWADLSKLGLTAKEEAQLRKEIGERIETGEDQIARQDLNSLAE